MKKLLIFLFFLTGCAAGVGTTATTPTALSATREAPVVVASPTLAPERPTETAVPPTPSLLPTETLVPTPTTGAGGETAVPTATLEATGEESTLEAELEAFFWQEVVMTPPSEEDAFQGVSVVPLANNVWLLHTIGFRPYETLGNHLVALYAYDGGVWKGLSRLDLEVSDFVFEEGVAQFDLGGDDLWFTVESGAGAHGGCFDLLHYDGQALQNEINHCSATAGAAIIPDDDLNGDGRPDLVLNLTDYYVFCYACSVQLPDYEVHTWDGASWNRVGLRALPDSVPVAVREANDEALRLAGAGLWQEAGVLINGVSSEEPTFVWNRSLINLQVEALQAGIDRGVYPLLEHLFYGDYEGVLNLMRGYQPQLLFRVEDNPLIVGTVAEGWQDVLAGWIAFATNPAIEAQPDLAAAYFLRGWGAYLVDPNDAQVRADVKMARSLAPDELLYERVLVYLEG